MFLDRNLATESDCSLLSHRVGRDLWPRDSDDLRKRNDHNVEDAEVDGGEGGRMSE